MPARSALERRFYGAAEVNAYIYPDSGVGPPTKDKRTVGFFWFMNAIAANSFLSIPPEYGLEPEGSVLLRVEASTRTLALVGGGDGQTAVEAHDRSRGTKAKQGSKSIILTTGKPTREGGKRKAIITARFPSWLQAWEIADILGEAIPTSKIKEVPTASDIRPYFRIKGGLTYRIASSATATSTAVPKVPTSQGDANTLGTATKEGRGKKA